VDEAVGRKPIIVAEVEEPLDPPVPFPGEAQDTGVVIAIPVMSGSEDQNVVLPTGWDQFGLVKQGLEFMMASIVTLVIIGREPKSPHIQRRCRRLLGIRHGVCSFQRWVSVSSNLQSDTLGKAYITYSNAICQ